MERYEAPVAEIVTFAMQDIVTASCNEDCPLNGGKTLNADGPVAYEPSNW
ncbi:MAG: hypothetical protein UH824_09880 [Acutalibacteraceae bacterium]|nr:hypothetical protein [Acutalibacteraceae bacterium]